MRRYSVLGYVVNPEDPGWFKMLRGRDITAILLRHFRKLGASASSSQKILNYLSQLWLLP